MIPSRETLIEAQGRTQFAAPQLEIVIRLRDLLERMAADRDLVDGLVLKGGTPLNLCFGPPPRLSVDLDFNYIGAADRARMLKARPEIVAALERLGRRAGYQVQRSTEDHAGQKFYFRYRSALGTAARLQVDINFLFRTPVLAVQSHPVWSPLDEASFETSVVAMGELMAGKMLALIDRSAPRDLFDVARYATRSAGAALPNRKANQLEAGERAVAEVKLSVRQLSGRVALVVGDDLDGQVRGGRVGLCHDSFLQWNRDVVVPS